MEHEPGDDYIRRIATYIRTHEQRLAAAAIPRRRRAKAPDNAGASIFDPFGWFTSHGAAEQVNVKPLVLAFDAHHLYYLLMRMEALGLPIGSLDVKVENPSRPMNYITIPGADKSDTLSLRSFASTFSAVSRLSLGGSWWGRPTPPTVDAELRYIYSSFTILPAISLHAPEPRMILEISKEAIEHALPLEAFKYLQTLECLDIDPRTVLGWDRLAESLRSLTIKRSGVEDIGDVFIDAVLDDQARREGRSVMPTRRGSFRATQLPAAVPEDAEETHVHVEEGQAPPPVAQTPDPAQSSLKWAFLQHLSLAENALTFLATAPLQRLTSVTHLDLSSNLLVSVPSGLSALYNLVSLNLSDNMIDSVLGIYTMLGSILSLNLSRNRLESICGLERLLALERVDLRHNLIEESAEIGRLATLPNIVEVWVDGNPLTELEEGYRIRCFDIFWKEGKTILLDGTQPGFYEKQYLTTQPPEQMTSTRQPSTSAYSPPVIPVGGSPRTNGVAGPSHYTPGQSPATSAPVSQAASPALAAVGGRGRRKKNKRIVDLDGSSDLAGSRSASHVRPTVGSQKSSPFNAPSDLQDEDAHNASRLDPTPPPEAGPSMVAQSAPRPPTKFVSRHTRHQTEFSPPSSPVSALSGKAPFNPPSVRAPPPSDRPSVMHRRSATMMSRSATRRSRVSASLYEPPPTPGAEEGNQFSEAEAFRARIEALRSDMGESWLKVFNQSHMSTPSPTPRVSTSGL